MKISALLVSLLLSAPAMAAKPIYREAPPGKFCEAAPSFVSKAMNCEDNGVFLKKAQECWNKLEELQKKVSKDLEEKIGSPDITAQNQSMGTSSATYEEGIAAYEYMFHVTETALKEIDSYFDYVVYPEDAETDKEFMAAKCYKDTVVPLDALADQFDRKRAEIAGKLETADMLKNKDQANQAKEGASKGSAHPVASGGKSAAPVVKKGQSKNAHSDVTGLQEDKARNKQLPKK